MEEESVPDQEIINSAKENQLKDINREIIETIDAIKIIQNEILELKVSILNFSCANKLYAELETAHSTARKVSDSKEEGIVELNDEHLEIINKKRNDIDPLKRLSEELAQNQKVLIDRVFETGADIAESNGKILDLEEEIRQRTAQSYYMACENQWLQAQLTDVNNQRRTWDEMKRGAEQALSTLKERAMSVQTLDGGRLDLEKEIISLQNQLKTTEESIKDAKEKIATSEDTKKLISDQNEEKTKKINETVDWENEKEDLKSELADLNQQIAELKKDVSKKEKNANTATSNIAKYAPLVKKWANCKDEIEVSDEPISKLYADLEKTRKDAEARHQEEQNRLSQLVVENGKLSKALERKRRKLENVIMQFHAEEYANEKQIIADREAYDAEEVRLLNVINQAKLKVANKFLRQ